MKDPDFIPFDKKQLAQKDRNLELDEGLQLLDDLYKSKPMIESSDAPKQIEDKKEKKRKKKWLTKPH